MYLWLYKQANTGGAQIAVDQGASATAENQKEPLSELVLREASRWDFSSWLATLRRCRDCPDDETCLL